MLAGACHPEPDTVGVRAAQGAVRVQEVVYDACNIDLRPTNDPVQGCRYRAEVGDEFGGDGYAVPTCVHSKLTKQLSRAIRLTLRPKRSADDERLRHRDRLTGLSGTDDACRFSHDWHRRTA